MPSLCDINVLVALAYRKQQFHPVAAAWLTDVTTAREIALCRVSQLGFLRLLNNPVVMKTDALSVADVWRILDSMMHDERFYFAEEPRGLDKIMREFMLGQQFSPKLWQDAYLAAFALAVGLTLVSFDVGFRQFKKLDLNLLS